MSDIPAYPKTPAEWLQYAKSKIVSSIPLNGDHKTDQNTYIERAIYLNELKLVNLADQLLYLYTDVFAFRQSKVTISPVAYSEIQVIARVITADEPIQLKFNPGNSGYTVYIYANVLEQPLSVSLGDDKPQTLEFGAGTEYVGVKLTVHKDAVNCSYQKAFAHNFDEDFQASLDTQLRVALSLFWSHTPIAISICSYVAAATTSPALYPQTNAQAVALGQQLAAQAMTGPEMGYAPVLKIDQYLPTVRDALKAVSAFDDQYQRFQDKEQDVDQIIDAWSLMLKSTQTQLARDKNLSSSAWDKYQDACTVVARCQEQLSVDNRQVGDAASTFSAGLNAWYAKTYLKATFYAISGIVKFANGLGVISLGFESDFGDAAGDLGSAIDLVITAENESDESGKSIPSATLRNLSDCMQALESLYPSTEKLVVGMRELENNPNADIPFFDKITGSADGDVDSRAIVTLAAWETWSLDADAQLNYAIEQGIDGASDYQVALRKQAVNGKALAQAQAQAIKAGHEYAQAVLEVVACNKDAANLKELLKQYQGNKEQYALAEAKFYNRVLAIRTSLVIQMQKLVWAYKYRALADSSVVLDSQKETIDFQADLLILDQEIQTADEKYATDYQPFEYKLPSKELPVNYGNLMIQGLQGDSHSASFTLAPTLNPKASDSFATVFNDGSHFRLEGLETILQGVVPRPDALNNGVGKVDIDISTSGVYADIQGNKIFHFTSLARQVRLSYEIAEDGTVLDTLVHAIFPTQEHAEPTPFTQWTIKLRNPEVLDLSGLTGVELHWKGNARFESNKIRISN
ncbi:hypothetical protein F5Y11DRAFT_331864 [Daldinia sp. FL1419]|nr:hypothetical protein F5Y11DRAFT_331864 [Daldinia sp. FL1419]